MERIRIMLQYDSCLAIDVEGRSGGLAIMWKDSVKCRVMNYSRNFINIIVEDEDKGEWRLTCYYGYPERNRRKLAWDLLRELRDMSTLPWCVIGDFNDLLSQEDKKGLLPHPNWLCSGFRNAVNDCDLTDIHLEGYPYTWIKSRGTGHVIEERLDRALVSSEWLYKFPDAKLINLVSSHSDHSPILLQCTPMIRQHYKYEFKFENSWLKEEDIGEVVDEGWRKGAGLDIVHRLTQCANQLQRWGRRKRKRFKEEIMMHEAEMARSRDQRDATEIARFQEAQKQHAKFLVQEEAFWRQRAKMNWLKDGDLNTKFFHMSATTRAKVKKIEKLKNDENEVITGQQNLCEVARRYFQELFKPKGGAQEPVLSLITPRVSEEDNERLSAPISKEELRLALFQMHPDKSPGPDGFNPTFFQKIYEEASGQEINLSKSEVFFSRNLSRAAQEDLSNIMGVKHVLGTGTYLGLPSIVGRIKKETFAYIKDRIWKRINSWRSRPLSRAGKEVMIKSVLQAIPAYVMSIYLLPESLIDEIERMINSFWWGGGNNNKSIRWLTWENMAHPKEEGGLGFRDFQSFNMAMVAKQWWNLMNKPFTLVAKIFKARYFPHSSFIDSKLGNNPSFVWRSIWKSRQVLLDGCRWQIGDGSNIRVMHEPWLRVDQERWIMAPQKQEVFSHLFHISFKPIAFALTDEQNESKVANEDGMDGKALSMGFGIGMVEIAGVLDVKMVLMNSEVQKEDKLPWLDVIKGENMVVFGGADTGLKP
ncbi:hypothetical protein TSUD_378900 [Trifolium subterraneum]|uniref:Endonuclease/exonuclease/phosphatase domain-containing protein n=1 Tax=Trifolium subterraneum TaxID=3900 RepID=A0A2Z6N2E3_TRISU|nr:hypothetical protein TSUD_378900 [Trifolium subterraneum]